VFAAKKSIHFDAVLRSSANKTELLKNFSVTAIMEEIIRRDHAR
jgi:hypothetical protein